MPLYFGPRLHALTHSLFRQSDKAETQELYARVHDMFVRHEDHPLVDAFQGIKPDDLTPRQALELLYKLKQLTDDSTQ